MKKTLNMESVDKALAEKSKKYDSRKLTSAIQIRLGGCKGVLALNPTLPKNVSVQIRKSMEKFLLKHVLCYIF